MIELSSPLSPYLRVQNIVQRNSHIFRTPKAAYYFLEKHNDELLKRGAIARVGTSQRAPILVNEEILLATFKEWANS